MLLKAYVAAVCSCGLGLLAALLGLTDWSALGQSPLILAAVSAVVVLGELKPLPLVADEDLQLEATVSGCFAVALACIAPLGLAAAVLALALVVADLRQRKAGYKIVFNVAQYVLALAAARWCFGALAGEPLLTSSGQFGAADALPALAGAAVFYLVNTLLTSTVLALVDQAPWLHSVVRDLVGQAPSAGVLLSLTPVVAFSAPASPVMLALLLLPVVAVHHAASLAQARQHQATHDLLTGLPNRVLFQDRLRAAAQQPDARALVLLLDLDHFREVNDTLGHAAGDVVLREVAARLTAALDELDAEHCVARLGGDEFGVLLLDAGAADLPRLEAALQARLEQHLLLDDIELDVRVSGGAVLLPDDGRDADLLLQRADVALYAAKEERPRIRLYDAQLDRHSPLRLGLAAALRADVLEDRLEVHYQAQLDAATGRLVAVEALARWSHKELGWISPGTFIPLAESTDLIGPLTELVLRKALRDLRRSRRRTRRCCSPSTSRPGCSATLTCPSGCCACWQRRGATRRCCSWRSPRAPSCRTARARSTSSPGCARPASGSRSTTSAPATRACRSCAACTSTRSRSTARSSWGSRAAPERRATSSSCAASSSLVTTSA